MGVPVSVPSPSESLRDREAREAAIRKRARSLRLGSSGLVVLFLAGIGTVLYPDYVAAFLVAMVVGFLLVLAAFLVIRPVAGSAVRLRDLLKQP